MIGECRRMRMFFIKPFEAIKKYFQSKEYLKDTDSMSQTQTPFKPIELTCDIRDITFW